MTAARNIPTIKNSRALGYHRRELGDPGTVAEADEQRDRGVYHPLGPGDHAGAAAEAGEPVPLAGMVALDPVRLLLADVEAALRDRLAVGRPVVRAVQAHAPALQALKQSFESGLVTTAQLPVDDPSGSTIPSLPDPEFVGLFFRKCHISSSSTTTARPSGSGFWAYALANCSIQVITLGVDTPSSLAVRFIDNPLRYSRTAVTFTRRGIPRGGVSVKFSPQALQR